MKIVVFGAAGRTGKYIVRYALEAGHEVTAFVRDKSKLALPHERLTIVVGNVYDRDAVFNAVNGNEVVISAIGTNSIDDEKAVNLMSDAMKTFAEAMTHFGIKRVLAIGGLGVLQADERTQLIDQPGYPPAYKLIGVGHNKVYLLLRETNLDWTLVCCPNIVDAPRTGSYKANKEYPIKGADHINTGDIADFMLREMTENKFLKTRVGIGNVT